MIRFGLIFGALIVLILLGLRNYFIPLCALVVLTAIADHENFRDNLFGLQGFKPWNVLCAFVVLEWFIQRGLYMVPGRLPHHWILGFFLFAFASLWGATLNFAVTLGGMDPAGVIIDEFVNPIKLMIVGVLVYDACRSRERVIAILIMCVGLCTVFAVFIIKYIPITSLLDPDSVLMYRIRIQKQIGLHPNDIVSALVPGLWTMLFLRHALTIRWARHLLLGLAGVAGVALLLTQSRTGMVALVGVALGVGVLRYHKLGLATLALSIVAIFSVPSLSANWSRGFGVQKADGRSETDLDEVTNGRVELWQNVLSDISKSPWLGNGNNYWYVYPAANYKLASHPHNAYLEILVNAGIFALIAVLAFFGGLFAVAARLMRKGRNIFEVTVGSCATAGLLTHFIVGFGGRAFTPRTSAVITYCLCGLALRVYYSVLPQRVSDRAIAARPAPRTPLPRRSRIQPLPMVR